MNQWDASLEWISRQAWYIDDEHLEKFDYESYIVGLEEDEWEGMPSETDDFEE